MSKRKELIKALKMRCDDIAAQLDNGSPYSAAFKMVLDLNYKMIEVMETLNAKK